MSFIGIAMNVFVFAIPIVIIIAIFVKFNRMETNKVTPKDFFLYLGIIISLYATTGFILSLIFDIINTYFPDVIAFQSDYGYSIRFAMAGLIVTFPIFYFISRLIGKEIRINAEKATLWIRKWVIYLTLFLSGVTIAVDLVTLLNSFLNGEITTRFVLKALTTFVIAGLIFWNYINELKVSEAGKNLKNIFRIVAVAIFALAIIGGFIASGSPFTARLQKLDQQRVNDLQTIQSQIINFWQMKGTLPGTLDELNNSISGYSVPLDPVGKGYTYQAVNKTGFKLCATFDLQSDQNANRQPVTMGYLDQNWTHGTGETCFDRVIDPQLYPVIKK